MEKNLVVLVIVFITIINPLRLRLAFLVEMTPRHVRLVPPSNFSRLEHAYYGRMVEEERLTLPFQGHYSRPSPTAVSVPISGGTVACRPRRVGKRTDGRQCSPR